MAIQRVPDPHRIEYRIFVNPGMLKIHMGYRYRMFGKSPDFEDSRGITYRFLRSS